jgi:hypothetical protein
MASCVFLCWALLGMGDNGVDESERTPTPSQVGLAAPEHSAASRLAQCATHTLRAMGNRVAGHGTVLAAAALMALVVSCVIYQFQYLPRFVPYRSLDAWMSSGPYWGIHVTKERKEYLEQFARDLEAKSTPQDRLLVYPQLPGAYLYWPYRTATCSVWIGETPGEESLPPYLREWMRQHDVVPTLFVRTTGIGDITNAEYQRLYGAELGYRIVLRRSQYVFLRRPLLHTPSFMRQP